MSNKFRDRTIALAAVFQTADMVREIAQRGTTDESDVECLLGSLFVEEPENTESVFGHLIHLRRGLQGILDQLGNESSQRDLEMARYVITLLHLERKLNKRSAMKDEIFRGLDRVGEQRIHFPITHNNILASLAQIYSDTVSTLSPRLMVSGESLHLNNDANANKIRALLLAGIRAAVLFSQVGGRRWQILVQRRRFLESADWLLHQELPKSYN